MVACQDVVYPGEDDGVKLVYLYTFGAYGVQMALLEWTVVGGVAKSVEKRSDLNTVLGLLLEQMEKLAGNRVISEVEILQMYGVAGVPDGLKHILKLFLTRSKQGYGIVVRKTYAPLLQFVYDNRV